MSNKVIVKVNEPDPKPETIKKHKNFGSFISNYYQYHTPSGFRKLWLKDRRKLIFAVIIIVLMLLFLLGEL